MISGEFNQDVLLCTSCILAATRKNVVVGEGALPAEVFILLEAPGWTEDVMGIPACGRSGLILRRTLNKYGIIGRHFLTNTVLCRPPDNREPTLEEQSKCWTLYLMDRCAPKVVLCVGTVAYAYLCNLCEVIEDVNYSLMEGKRVYCIPHPASILYSNNKVDIWKKKVKVVCEMILSYLNTV